MKSPALPRDGHRPIVAPVRSSISKAFNNLRRSDKPRPIVALLKGIPKSRFNTPPTPEAEPDDIAARIKLAMIAGLGEAKGGA